jgi:hypothetical protein
MAGMLAYLAAEVLPDLMGSRTAHRLNRKAASVLDPTRSLRTRQADLDRADTVENRRLLAEEHVARGEFEAAAKLYDASLTGVHHDDIALLMGLARSRLGMQDYAGAIAALDRLREAHPNFESSEAHLGYARCLEGLGRDEEAEAEYAHLVGYAAGEEARCRYGQLLMRRGRSAEARRVFAQVLKYAAPGFEPLPARSADLDSDGRTRARQRLKTRPRFALAWPPLRPDIDPGRLAADVCLANPVRSGRKQP